MGGGEVDGKGEGVHVGCGGGDRERVHKGRGVVHEGVT